MPSILLFGVTGLIGCKYIIFTKAPTLSNFQPAHLILALKKQYPDFPVTVYLRNANIDDYLSSTAGASRIVHGSYSEASKISSLAKEHDIVINVGSSWDVGLSEAIVAGLNERDEDKKSILIHMSGTGNFVETRWKDGAHHDDSKVWSVSLFPRYPFQ
jgi:hypothetical protein